jgi:hypothetical protein
MSASLSSLEEDVPIDKAFAIFREKIKVGMSFEISIKNSIFL